MLKKVVAAIQADNVMITGLMNNIANSAHELKPDKATTIVVGYPLSATYIATVPSSVSCLLFSLLFACPIGVTGVISSTGFLSASVRCAACTCIYMTSYRPSRLTISFITSSPRGASLSPSYTVHCFSSFCLLANTTHTSSLDDSARRLLQSNPRSSSNPC